MKSVNITAKFPDQKLSALRLYAGKKDITVEKELEDALNKLYEKLVPPPVREYLDITAAVAPAKKPEKPHPNLQQSGQSQPTVSPPETQNKEGDQR